MLYVCAVVHLAIGPRIVFAQPSEFDTISSLIREGKLPDAEQRLKTYLQAHPRSLRAMNLIGTLYLQEGLFPQAEAAFKNAIAVDATSSEARINLGDAYLAAGDLDSALSAFLETAKLVPGNTRLNLELAKVYLARDDFARSLEMAAKIPPTKRTSALLPTLAADYFGLEQPQKAEVEIQAMLQISGRQPDLIAELVEFFIAHRDFNSAQQLIELAESKQLKTERLRIDLALTQAGSDRLNDAQNTLEAVLEERPDSIPALAAAGQVASQQLNWNAAVEAFDRAARLGPERIDILYGLVTAQLYANQPENALKNARKLQLQIPDAPRTNYVMALAFFGIHDGEQAKHYAQRVLEAHPEDREMHLILADIALNDEHDVAAARAQAEICLRDYPNDPGALYYLGMAEKMDGDVKGAIESLSKSVNVNPKNAHAQGALGALSLQAGDVPLAVRSLEQAVQLAPEEAQNHYELALGYSRLGSPEKARAQLDLYSQIKAKQASDAKNVKGPSTSEIPHVAIGSRP